MMRRFIGKAITIISFFLIGGCAPDARNEGSKVTNTVEFPRPKVVKEEGFNIARGATRIQDMKVIFDPVTKGMKLKGKIEYIPMNGESLRVIDLDLSGVEDGNGFIPLTKDAQIRFKNDEKVAAKATCLRENGSCEDSFVDIYIYIDGVVYHHQIESHQDLQGSASKGDEQKSSQGSGKMDDEPKQNKNPKKKDDEKKKSPGSLKSEDKQNKNQGSTKQKGGQKKRDESANQEDELQQTPDIANEEDDSESEGDSDDVGDVGQYVGSIKEDIETLLQIKPEEVKKEEPSKEEVTKEEPKGDDPKKEDPKKEEPKKDDPKKEEPKNGDPNRVTPKKEEPQKEKPKDGDSNKVTPTKDESKKEEPKKETLNMNISQAIGPVNAGRLENAVDFYKYEKKNDPTGFHIIRPERKTHFGTNELLYIIAQIGQITKENLPGQIVSIGDLSYERGGRLGKHKSHQNGLDSDVSYYFNKKSLQGRLTSAVDGNRPHPNWMYEEQWKLFKYIVKTQYVDRIFIHKVLKKALCSLAIQKGELEKGKNVGLAYETLRRLNPDEEFHDNHFHLRVKCSKAQKRCRQMAEPKPGSGCF